MSALALVLHAHQPDVRGDGLAETWVRDALRDCYVPLLALFRRMQPRVSMSVSPTLLAQGFPPFADIALVEWMTTTETHALLPIMRDDAARLRQIKRGRAQFTAACGLQPRGFWLPELAFSPGLDRVVAQAGYTHMVLEQGYGQCAVRCLQRDAVLAERIWSRESGLPGHPLYRDFHKTDGAGRKLWRITDRTSDDKALYDAEAARAQAVADACAVAAEINARTDTVMAAFDAELFGHWWYEGPAFLEALFERVDLVTLQDVRADTPVQPPQASWGEHGDLRTWLQPANAWMLSELHAAQALVTARTPEAALAALALAESSDWAFMLGRGHFEAFATRQFRTALQRFYGLAPQ